MRYDTLKENAIKMPAFRRWFTGSAVTNRDGTPMIVYHGTIKGSVPEFMPMTHFGTADAAAARLRQFSGFLPWGWDDQAEQHLQDPDYKPHLDQLAVGDDYHIYQPSSQVVPVYLAIKKPLRISDDGQPHTADVVASQLLGRWDFYEQTDMDEDQLDNILHRLKTKRSFGPLLNFLRGLGYDGMTYVNVVEDHSSTSWVVFAKKQIWPVFASKPL